MAVVLLEGFDHYGPGDRIGKGWSAAGGTAVTGRFSVGQAIQSAGSAVIAKTLPSSYSTLWVGFAFKVTTQVAQDIFVVRNGATNVARIALVVSGADRVLRVTNAGGTTLCTGTTPIAVSTFYYIEMKVVVNASTGTIDLWLNGGSSTEAAGSSLNTGSSNIDNVGMNWVNGIVQTYDDIYVVDSSGSSPTNTRLGESRIDVLPPTGNGANTAWTGAFGDVDDGTTIDNDTTFISSSTPGDRETYSLTDLPSTAGTIFAVQTNLFARKDDASARTIAPVIRISGTDYDGTTSVPLGVEYMDYTQLYDRLDPSGAAWTTATVNAMEAGVKEVA